MYPCWGALQCVCFTSSSCTRCFQVELEDQGWQPKPDEACVINFIPVLGLGLIRVIPGKYCCRKGEDYLFLEKGVTAVVLMARVHMTPSLKHGKKIE